MISQDTPGLLELSDFLLETRAVQINRMGEVDLVGNAQAAPWLG